MCVDGWNMVPVTDVHVYSQSALLVVAVRIEVHHVLLAWDLCPCSLNKLT
jgi:hypothetical protein